MLSFYSETGKVKVVAIEYIWIGFMATLTLFSYKWIFVGLHST